MPEFGTLERVDVREAWKDETGKFTPWLSTNLERLTEVIGIPLELIGREVRVEAILSGYPCPQLYRRQCGAG